MEALHMYEDTMLKKDRVKPNAFVFNVLIGGLGKVGYTKKAFGLFRKVSLDMCAHLFLNLFVC